MQARVCGEDNQASKETHHDRQEAECSLAAHGGGRHRRGDDGDSAAATAGECPAGSRVADGKGQAHGT
jgi:hypothetical protein